MSDQNSSPTDEMVLRDLVMALTRPLSPSAPGLSPPAGVGPSSVQEGASGGASRDLRPQGAILDLGAEACAAQALDPQSKAFGAQLDVLLVEASLRLQAQVTMVRPARDVGSVATAGAPTAAAFADGQELGMVGQMARWAAKGRVALAGGALLLAVLTFWGGQPARHDVVSGEGPSPPQLADRIKMPPAAGSSSVPKSIPGGPVGSPIGIPVGPARDPLPPQSIVTAPLVVLSPEVGTASSDNPQDAETSQLSFLDRRPGGQEPLESSERSALLDSDGSGPTAATAPVLNRVEGAGTPAAKTDPPEDARAEPPTPVTPPLQKPRSLPAEETPPVSQPARPAAGTWVAAVTPDVPKSQPSGAQSAPSKTSAKRYAPALIALRDATSALQVFIALQKRHPVLSGKVPEVRPIAGEEQTTWYQLLIGPPVTQKEAEELCRRLGPEGQTLDCTVTAHSSE